MIRLIGNAVRGNARHEFTENYLAEAVAAAVKGAVITSGAGQFGGKESIAVA